MYATQLSSQPNQKTLTKELFGSFCVIKNQYPWGEFNMYNEYN